MTKLLLLVALVGIAAAGSNNSPARTLAPLVQKYQDLIYAGKYDELEDLYHPNAVLVAIGKPNPFYTPEKIFEEIKDARSKVDNARTVILKEDFSGAGDILMYENQWKITTSNFELSGPYRSVWVKYEGRWVIYHEEYSQTKRHRHHSY
ncbi:unnamed protein product, partial [Mesorhabditis spiculigera]